MFLRSENQISEKDQTPPIKPNSINIVNAIRLINKIIYRTRRWTII